MSVTVLHATEPVLVTPGTATWTHEATATGTKTVFTLDGNTVLNWDQLNLASGSEMEFNFVSGKTVVNFLGGTTTHLIDGSVTSNGIVAFFSPTASLQVNGSIIAKGVTLATLNTDPDAFASGNFEMTGTAGTNNLKVNGQVEATDGDVLLGGQRIRIGATAKIQASQDALYAGGRTISVSSTGDSRLEDTSGIGFILHNGETNASRIEVVAGEEITNHGALNPTKGRIFLTVGTDGKITNESTGVIVGEKVLSGTYDSKGVILVPDEGDAVPAVSESTLTIPKLSRPDGAKVTTKPSTLTYSIPMSASSDAGRDAGHIERNDRRVAKNDSSKSLFQRSSFFGMRGGSDRIVKR